MEAFAQIKSFVKMQCYRALAESNDHDEDISIISISSDGEYVAVVEGSTQLIVSTSQLCARRYTVILIIVMHLHNI